MACPITVAKFVGTISLGLLTGLSYSASTITLPALQSLPTASGAARTLNEIQVRTRRRVVTLSNLTALSLLTAFTLASPRRKHPYLIWTSLVAFIGGTGLECWTNRKTMSWDVLGLCSFSCSSSQDSSSGVGFGSWFATHLGGKKASTAKDRALEEEESNGNGSEIEIVEQADAESANITREHSVAPDSEYETVNGESVKEQMERERRYQKLRTWILGIGFSMGVVGIWGEGA